MHILAVANGSIDGNSEILLKAALKAVQEVNSSITTSWVHMPSVRIPPNPKPLQGSMDVSLGANEGMQAGNEPDKDLVDDRQALLEAFMDADAYIIATPIYSHSPAGFLKAAMDRIGGPYMDAVFAETVLEVQKKGDSHFADIKIDQRIIKPRVAAFMAIGGSTVPDQFTMALPILHTLVYPMQAKVVDQVIFEGCGGPGSVLAQADGALLDRAAQLGKNVASEIGKTYDEARFLGEEPEGACPYCHLAKIDLFYTKENKIGCIACGAVGYLTVGADGIVRPTWNPNCDVSCITRAGKIAHLYDIQKGALAATYDMQN
jgi:multimeric flavodoxin WrbA